jgi:hypothetical protein
LALGTAGAPRASGVVESDVLPRIAAA